MYNYFTIDNFDFKGKVTGIRVDINSPAINGKIILNERITAHAKTISELSKKGAKVVILSHQGRNGNDDCVSLKEHAKILSKECNLKIDFISEIYSKDVELKIAQMKDSQIILLENLRFYEDENEPEKKDNLILKLENLFDYYVMDAFSIAHRKQTSIIGFSKIPIIAGRVMEKELLGLNKINKLKSPVLYVFGGAKPDDLIKILETNLKEEKVDFVLLCGVIGEIALLSKNFDIGAKKKILEEKGYLKNFEKIKNLLETYPENFVLPKDVAIYDGKKRIEISVEEIQSKRELIEKYEISDIGTKTLSFYSNFIKNSGSIYFKGPAGNFENENFESGTIGILKGIVNSGAFSFMGGGHSVTAAQKFVNLSDFSYVSLAGGALVKYLSGEKLPGIEILEKSFNINDKILEDFLVIGSNTLDINVSVPCQLNNFHLGDKIRVEEDFKTTIGGGGINVSICLSRLGAKVIYVGKISYENADKIKNVLERDKVNLALCKISKKPCAKSILIDTKDDDRVILTYRGQNSFLEETDFDISKSHAKNFYFSSLSGQSFKTMLSVSKKIRQKKENMICFNLSSHLIKVEKSLKSLVKNTDILILNFEEAQMFIGKSNITLCLKEIKKLVSKIVIITDGANGAFAYDGEKEYHITSVKPKKIVDTTGAGDAFAGTFFFFYTKGFGIEKALEFAAINSSNVISYKGAHDGLKYYDDIVA